MLLKVTNRKSAVFKSIIDKSFFGNVARNEKQLLDAKEIIKDPMYLEYLGLHLEA